MAFIAWAVMCSVMVGEARAGCNDGACGRVDWTEVTELDEGAPLTAKLHGAYAWEASPDGWGTHPVAGTVSGYFWLTCTAPSGAADAVCKQQLATEMAKVGTDRTLNFAGTYFTDAGVTRPAGLFAEGEASSPASLVDLLLGGAPINPEVCRAALALPRNAGGAGGGPASDASPGGASGAGPAPNDDGGCSTAGRGSAGHVGGAAFFFVAAMLGVARRRSRD